ncbi:MAG: hypothetical protein ACO1OB_34540 [Archangium sp.]
MFRILAVSSVVLMACGESQQGENGSLRFGLIYTYAETDGFGPIAAGQVLPLSIQAKEKPAPLNDYPYLDGTLTSSGAEVERTGEGRFKTTFETPGTYTLTASANDLTDTLEVKVVAQTAIRLAKREVSIGTTSNGATCSTRIEVGAAWPALKTNQKITATIVPVDANDAPLLGQLTLESKGTANATGTLVVTGALLNTYAFSSTTPGRQTVDLLDARTQQRLTFALEIEDGEATCP